MTRLSVADHPLLQLGAFVAELPNPLEALPSPDWLRAGLRLDAESPLSPPDERVRKAVRELLRHGGFKPSGRNKPASEFLLRAATEGSLGSINLAVDLCNVTSLHAGLPISVVDLDRLEPPLRVAIAEPGSSYVFNPNPVASRPARFAGGPTGRSDLDLRFRSGSTPAVRSCGSTGSCACSIAQVRARIRSRTASEPRPTRARSGRCVWSGAVKACSSAPRRPSPGIDRCTNVRVSECATSTSSSHARNLADAD